MRLSRFVWLAGSAAAMLLLALVAMLGPVRVQITLDHPVAAAGAAVPLNLPTTTPLPATAVPPTAIPATPAPTDVPIPATPESPREERRRPTATPLPATTEPTPPLPSYRLPQVAIVKQASPAVVRPGERVSFTLRVTNTGNGPAHDVVVTDELPRPLAVVDLRSTRGDIVVDGNRVTAYPRTLAPGETQTYTIVAQVPVDAPAGPLANTAVVTTSDPDDDPGDNTSTTTITIERAPFEKQSDPPRLPHTADPLDPTSRPFLAVYWPILALGCGLLCFGIATRAGAFRQQTMRVTVGGVPHSVDPVEHAELAGFAVGIELDPSDLVQRWRSGTATRDLVDRIAQQNPRADRLAVSIAVQRVLQAELRRG